MKKGATIFLVTCLMFSLVACSSGGNSKQSSQAQKATQTQRPTLPESNETENNETENNETENNKTEKGTSAKEEQTEEIPSENSATENSSAKAEQEANNETELNDELEVDFTYDYSEDIRADIDYVVSSSTSLQKELENVEAVIQKYNLLAEEAQSQGEMNVSSKWLYVIWDAELNNLWSRFSNSADQQTKENILADQRNWNDMKEEAVFENIGLSEENGSMYPLLENSFLEEITRNRVYVLANELAKIKGESFIMPEKSAKYGFFVDNQGTGSIYSSLITRQGVSGDDEAVISIYRLGEIKGVFVDNGNGELSFASNDADTRMVKGIIKINGWDGASFTVTEASQGFLSVGEEFDFPFAF